MVLGKFISLRVAEGRPKNSFPGNQGLDPLCTPKECLIAVAPNCSLVSGSPLFWLMCLLWFISLPCCPSRSQPYPSLWDIFKVSLKYAFRPPGYKCKCLLCSAATRVLISTCISLSNTASTLDLKYGKDASKLKICKSSNFDCSGSSLFEKS